MAIRIFCGLLGFAFLFAHASAGNATADDSQEGKRSKPAVYAAALFPFVERGAEAKGQGPKVTDLLFADLADEPRLLLVDREELQKVTAELELGLSGLTNPADANQVGRLTGARLLITGSIVHSDASVYLVAKIIGTETSRVVGVSAKGGTLDKLDALVDELAEQISAAVKDEAASLVAKPVAREEQVVALRKKLGKGERPVVWIEVTEQHVGQPSIDPAAQTELTQWLKYLGFTVLDSQTAARGDADVVITGEGFSQFAARHGNLVSVKARVEIKAVDRKSNEVLASDREVTVAADLSEQIAGKSALEQAAAKLAQRLLPKLAESKRDAE
jgi:TolB-like protein